MKKLCGACVRVFLLQPLEQHGTTPPVDRSWNSMSLASWSPCRAQVLNNARTRIVQRSMANVLCILMLIIGDDGDMFMVLICDVVFCSSSSCT